MIRVLSLILCCAAAPVVAQESELRRGTELLGDGARLILRGLIQEVEPAMRDLSDALDGWEFGFDGLPGYHAPEILPNGDIIIRRRVPRITEGIGPEIEL